MAPDFTIGKDLIERAACVGALQTAYRQAAAGEGHCVFITGEAGIGKTSLVKAFIRELKTDSPVYLGTCDALFTPRPLAPLFDILLQMRWTLPEPSGAAIDRTAFFINVFRQLQDIKKPVVLVFEDIHWADEATLDFIKFLARRITQLNCLFLLTYRDDEIHAHHPLRNVLGQVPADSLTRLQLQPLSKEAVNRLAATKGYNGENVFAISGGNPFYVNEILANYSAGIPENIKDSILSVYFRQDEQTRHAWDLLSILPAGIGISYLQAIGKPYMVAVERSIEAGILIMQDGLILFKHELYRRTIEAALSPVVNISLNKKILALLVERFEQQPEIQKIIQHAKNANEKEVLAQYAPIAARQAAQLGAHIEAARLWSMAIDYYPGDPSGDERIRLYESYAYECYLISQIQQAIQYTEKALKGWERKGDAGKAGNSMRFLSRLWWYAGSRDKAMEYGEQAAATFDQQPASGEKAMAYSNMAQLNMLSEQHDLCVAWGNKAIAMAKQLNEQEILCHALNNIGTVQIRTQSSLLQDMEPLQQSLDIALQNNYQEHAARAYTNLGSKTVALKAYGFAMKYLDEGIAYTLDHDLDLWTEYMSSMKARLLLETGQWDPAFSIATAVLENENQTAMNRFGALLITGSILLRRGSSSEALPRLLEAKTMAVDALELQRIQPALAALLEYKWLTGQDQIGPALIDRTLLMMEQSPNSFGYNEFVFWLKKTGKKTLPLKEIYRGFDERDGMSHAPTVWEKAGCPYEYALALFEGGEEEKRKAIGIIQQLGATAVYEKLKGDMRSLGMKSIPRGARKSTQINPGRLTTRELEVLQLLHEGMANKEIAAKLFISAKTVDHHISSILFKLDTTSRTKAVQEALKLGIVKAIS